MNGHKKRAQRKKESILAATEKLIFSKGITATSMEEIAKQANVSKVTIFNYFGTKDALVRSVFKRFMDSAMGEAEELLDSDMPFSRKIESFFSAGDQIKNSVDRRFLESVAWDDPAMQKLYDEIAATKGLPLMLRLFEEGKKEGVIDKTIPEEALMAYVGAIMTVLKDPNFLKSSDAFKHGIQELFYFGLLGKAGPDRK